MLALQRIDSRDGKVVARCAVERSETLITELNEAFGEDTPGSAATGPGAWAQEKPAVL